VNDPPTTTPDSFTTNEDTAFTTGDVLDNDSDLEGDSLSLTGIDTSNTQGQVTDNGDGTFEYNPNGQFESLAVGETATDRFSYTVSDGNATNTATVTLTIEGVNDAPEFSSISPIEVEENSDLDTVVQIIEATDPEQDSVIFNFDQENLPTDVDEDGELPFAINGTTGEITVNDPDDLNFERQDSFTFGVTATEADEGQLTSTANVTVNLTDVNELVSDINDDNLVNLDDLGIFGLAFLSQAGDENFNPDTDLTGDGLVNLNDLGLLAAQFGESA
jgi:VCBS repeat-containing protein